jgi:hypothetical protein
VDKADELLALVSVLWFLPPPARTPIAEGLHGLGVRVHPELATSVMVSDTTPGMGNHAAKAPMAKQALDFLRETQPDLAAKIQVAQQDPAARARLAAELRAKIANDVPELREQGAAVVAEFNT